MVKAELAKRNINYVQLVGMLEESHGVTDTPQNLSNKIARGKFSAVFANASDRSEYRVTALDKDTNPRIFTICHDEGKIEVTNQALKQHHNNREGQNGYGKAKSKIKDNQKYGNDLGSSVATGDIITNSPPYESHNIENRHHEKGEHRNGQSFSIAPLDFEVSGARCLGSYHGCSGAGLCNCRLSNR